MYSRGQFPKDNHYNIIGGILICFSKSDINKNIQKIKNWPVKQIESTY